jgi:hypothetical protein
LVIRPGASDRNEAQTLYANVRSVLEIAWRRDIGLLRAIHDPSGQTPYQWAP